MNAEEIQALRSELAEVSAAGAWSSPAAVKRWTGWIIEALPRALSALEACQRERDALLKERNAAALAADRNFAEREQWKALAEAARPDMLNGASHYAGSVRMRHERWVRDIDAALAGAQEPGK